MNKRIILASGSPRRKKALEQIGLEVEVIPSSYKEDMTIDADPGELAKILAAGKATDVASRVTEGIVIGMDTFIALDGYKIGKPKDANDATAMLRRISGRSVGVYSGIALIDAASGRQFSDFERTQVRMHTMSDQDIQAYVRTGEPLDKAGAFAIQGLGAVFVKDISWCYSNITGTPLYKLAHALSTFGVDIYEHRGWKTQSDL